MNTSRALPIAVWILAGFGVSLGPLSAARADDDVTAVSSKVVDKGYIRTKLLDGSYQPEGYFLRNGGRYDKPSGDASMDNKGFPDIARVIVPQLATQNYRAAADPKKGKLIIIVYWGTTIIPDFSMFHALDQVGGARTADLDQAALENFMRDNTDRRNAGLLGYDWHKINRAPAIFDFKYPEDGRNLSELEGERYFVVLMAYDCQEFLRRKKYKELWETRFSVSTRNTDFTKALPKMAKDASGYFGRDSHGVQHLPEGHVYVGETKSLGEVEPPQK